MNDCIFCKIAKKDIPSELLYEDDDIVAFNDIDPVAPVHVLIIPKMHISSLLEINEHNSDLISKIVIVANKLAEKLNLTEQGFRIVNNCGKYGGQTVDHIHFHLLAGRFMQWPPG